MKAAIAIDQWKLPLFERWLEQAGFAWKAIDAGNTMLMLTVEIADEQRQRLYEAVLGANTQAAIERASAAVAPRQ